MFIKNVVNMFMSLEDNTNRIPNKQIMFFAKSGHGKGSSIESIAQVYWNNGFIIIILADPKNTLEWGFAQFPPTEPYHLDILKKLNWQIKIQKVKLYHPFTFNIPKGYLPQTIFYTIPLKDLDRQEYAMLSESDFDSETVKLMMNTTHDISDNDGIYSYLHYVEKLVAGKKEGRKHKRDWNNFGLKVSSGTAKSVSDISNIFKPFKEDYFLAPANCKHNLDWKKILTDQEHFHVFTYNYIRDEKMQEFTILHLLEQIDRNIERYANHPVLIIIPEIRKLCPGYVMGYKLYLSREIKNSLSTVRGKGLGCSSICDSQNWDDTSPDVKNSATDTFFGELSPGDAERVAKARNYKREIRDKLSKMDGGKLRFIKVGEEGDGEFYFPPAQFAHREENTKFEDTYHKYSQKDPINYPESRYAELIKEMQKMYDDEEKKIKKLTKEEEEKEEREEQMRLDEKESKSLKTKKIDELSEKAIKLKEEKRQEKIKRVVAYWKEHNSDPKFSWNKVGKDCEVDPKMAKKYFIEWEESEKKKIGKTKDSDPEKKENSGTEKKEKIDIEVPEKKVNESIENDVKDVKVPDEFIGEGILPEETEEDQDKDILDEMDIEGREDKEESE